MLWPRPKQNAIVVQTDSGQRMENVTTAPLHPIPRQARPNVSVVRPDFGSAVNVTTKNRMGLHPRPHNAEQAVSSGPMQKQINVINVKQHLLP